MKKIDESYDNILGSNYELYSTSFSELKNIAKSWYEDVNFREFDERYVSSERYENDVIEMKKTGVICNFFFAYKEGDKFYLLDGFNRLFTDYGKFDYDSTVYLKILTDKLENHQLMRIMFHLNMWKLQSRGFSRNFDIDFFLDRGFKLLLYKKFGIEFYKREKEVDRNDTYDPDKYQKYIDRPQYSDDMKLINFYFIEESEMSGSFGFKISGVAKLLSHKNIVFDLKEIVENNKYKTPPFKNYEMFFEGFIMFLAWRRVNGDDSEYIFKDYLIKLEENKKFSNKLKGMSGTDSTRINIYKFFRELHKKQTDKQ